MYERESSVASSVDFYEPEGKLNAPSAQMQNDASAGKRKAADALSVADKKRKLAANAAAPSTSTSTQLRNCAGLPPAVWQHIFSFCSLADLGRLIQVNRSFHSYLTDVSDVPLLTPGDACLPLSLSEALWASARNAYNSNAPKPLSGLSELHMWQLVWSKRCQFCNKLDSSVPGEKLWQQGPGEAGVCTIWPFGIRACGPCLMQQCQTDASLLISSASALRPALPFALLTADQNYIPAYALQSTTTPANIEIGKYYYKKHVSDITQEMNNAITLGPAAAEEWVKGLEVRGNQRMKAAESWERWSVRNRDTKPTAAPTRSAATVPRKLSSSPKHQVVSPIIHAPVPAKPATPNTHFVHQRPPTIPPNIFTPQPGLTGSAQPNQQRNLHDANEAKATRKTDIERRCQEMSPPIAPNILRHMDAFKAAIQISQPMNEYAWSVLQPRLIANLPAAQQAEADHVSRVASLPTKTSDRRHQDANSKEAKEAMDREWEESQRPIRDRLSAIADDFTNRDWDHGKALTYENSPKFAADLLIHVRRTYYGESTGLAAALQPSELSDRRPPLVLENMKWVYDNKLKPLTEQYRRELFLCHGNDCDQAARLFGFEGVIQHYGAKHTSAFSSGNIVVAWREAEWPEETPFHPDPIAMKHAPHSSSNAAGYGGFYSGFSRAGTTTPHMPTHMPPHMPQASPGPYQYAGYNGPYAPPQVPYDYSQVYGAPTDGHPYHAMGPPGYGPHPGNPSYMPSPAVINPAVAPPPAMPPPPHGVIDPASNCEDSSHSTASFDKEVSTIIGLAQDMWKQTSGIKDMPNSLRIYVLLHRVISKFHIEFNYEPNLNHFIGALSNHEISKALKNAPGLSCKACQLHSTHYLTGAYYNKPEERRTYTVLTLFQHFRSQHLATNPSGIGYGQAPTALDWKEDMIELPSERIISGLIHAPGMDDEKLLMIATTFPSLFPHPLPAISKIEDDGLTSPASSGPMKDALRASGTPGVTLDRPALNAGASRTESPGPRKAPEDEDALERPSTASGRANQAPGLGHRKRSHRDTPPEQRGERYHGEPRYYLARDQPDDGYPRREYVDYAPSPRVHYAAPVYDEYSGRRTGFREAERYYGPPGEEIIYAARPHDGGHSRQYSTHLRQVRYAEDDGQRAEYQYPAEPQPREASGPRGQSAADRFLEEFVPEQPPASEEQPLPPPRPESGPPVSADDGEDNGRYTPPPPNPPPPSESETLARPLAPPQQPPSTVSNQSRYEAPPNGRHIPTPDSVGPPRRPGPQRRRDRPQEHRMPSRYYRYMSVAAREDPYGRAPSITRSQRSRYEEQRRRIDEAETPQPTTERDRAYEPTYSREHSVDHASPEHFYPPTRPAPRDYVSVQDRTHHFSPPRYHRYEDARGPPPPVYYDDYGQPEYEIVRVRGDYRQSRPYMGDYRHPAPVRYEPYHDPYMYERPPPQRYNTRPEDYIYYEDRERDRPPPRRPVHEPEAEAPEPPPVGVKIEVATPAPGIQD